MCVKRSYAHCRRTPLCFRLSVPVGSGVPSEGPLSHHLSQSGLPARSHPCYVWAWSPETVTAAEVSVGLSSLGHGWAFVENEGFSVHLTCSLHCTANPSH